MNPVADVQAGNGIGLEVFPESGTFYRTALESLSEGVMILDGDCRIIYANRLVYEITGYSPEELLGQTPYLLRADPQPADCAASKTPPDEPKCFEFEMKRKDGRLHWMYVKSTPYRNERDEVVGRVVALSCIAKQKNLEFENEFLQDEVRASFGNIIGRSPALQKVLAQITTVAPTEANVIILGESGTGKELVARAIHDLSSRKDRSLVRVNCASIPKELFESEFFGHVRGSFTGAIKDRVGRFELADDGTLFLDEIGEIPLDLQSKLLRVLQEGQFERVGDERTRTVKVRLIAATNRDLLAEAKASRFRLDLYYRLSVFPIEVPPLRERLEDVGELAQHFIKQAARRLGVTQPRLTKLQVQELQDYDWPGNVRELQNVIERAVILARGGKLQFDLPHRSNSEARPNRATVVSQRAEEEDLSFDELEVREREILVAGLRKTNWKIYGADGAAALLRIKPTTLVSKMKRLKVQKERA
ncbi:MAG TPA: sigma 54-interacting transcriptional regulator [Candidatus Binatia bacterium]|jgi:PAS domain S-box-containing protein|nr:sigma 54-interacting transcriptional regulator [Candidatus Binatia bacterium]